VALRTDHDDIAASAAIAATWTTAGNELLPPEGHAAVAAVAGLDANFCFIDEHGLPGIRGQRSELRELRFADYGIHVSQKVRYRLSSLPEEAYNRLQHI
jgi:hypothetical protein